MNTEDFAKWFEKIEGIHVVEVKVDRVYFAITTENLIKRVTKIADASDNFLSIHDAPDGIVFCLHTHKLDVFVQLWENKTTSKLGIPDLSLVTVKQMMNELKKRENISFAFVMTENTGLNNILLEASGNPTYICGLLSRASSLATKFADKDITYYHNEGDKNG